MNDQEANELVDQAFAPNNGMPPFPGLDLFNPVDRAFWYGDGSGGQPLTLSLEMPAFEVDEEQRVVITDGTTRVLMAPGWTPPPVT